MRPDTVGVFQETRRALEDAGVAYALVGATALGAYTLPRATLDLDFLVEATERPLPETLRGLHLVEKTRDVFFDQEAFIFEVATYVTPVEMFVATHWLPREALQRRRVVALPGLGDTPLVRADDAALLKAVVATHPARFASKRVSDVADLRRLHDASPELDVSRMRERAARLGGAATSLLREAGFSV